MQHQQKTNSRENKFQMSKCSNESVICSQLELSCLSTFFCLFVCVDELVSFHGLANRGSSESSPSGSSGSFGSPGTWCNFLLSYISSPLRCLFPIGSLIWLWRCSGNISTVIITKNVLTCIMFPFFNINLNRKASHSLGSVDLGSRHRPSIYLQHICQNKLNPLQVQTRWLGSEKRIMRQTWENGSSPSKLLTWHSLMFLKCPTVGGLGSEVRGGPWILPFHVILQWFAVQNFIRPIRCIAEVWRSKWKF